MTEITIYNSSKHKYSNGSYPEITKIIWRIEELDDKILKNFPNLVELNCDDNWITDLTPLSNCTSLTTLYCSENHIKDLNPLINCILLENLYCAENNISDLSPLSKCKSLTSLSCHDNKITDISPLSNCTSLTMLGFNNNKIKSLEPLSNCRQLDILAFKNNQITDLTPLSNCTLLTQLYCENNKINNLEPLIYLRRLTGLDCSKNPLKPPTIQVLRLIKRIEQNYNNNHIDTIYNDDQNIHDTQIQKSVMDSVRNLMRDKEVKFDLNSLLNSELKANTKSRLLEYFEEDKDEPHVILLITYKELFTYVWNRIMNNPNKLELLKILDDNIQDSECQCFTGRFNRTLSTLVGFYDDIQINISDNSRISAIILNIKDSLNPYNPNKHKELAQTALRAAGYDQNTIELWIEAI